MRAAAPVPERPEDAVQRFQPENLIILRGRAMSTTTDVIVITTIVAVLGSAAVAMDWAKQNHRVLETPGQYVDAAITALGNAEYRDALPTRIKTALGSKSDDPPKTEEAPVEFVSSQQSSGIHDLFADAQAAAGRRSVATFENTVLPVLKKAGQSLTYESARATGGSSFVLNKVVLSGTFIPGTDDEVDQIDTLEIRDIDFDGIRSTGLPRHLAIRMFGLVPDPWISGVVSPYLGGRPVALNVTLDFAIDDRGTLDVRQASLELPGLARLQVLTKITGFPTPGQLFSETVAARYFVHHTEIVYDDHKLLATALPVLWKDNNQDTDTQVGKIVAQLLSAQPSDPKNKEFASAFGAFLRDYKNPHGPLTMTFDPPDGTHALAIFSTPNLMKIFIGGEAPRMLGAKVSYAAANDISPATIR